METVMKAHCFRVLFDRGTACTFLFSAAAGLLMAALCAPLGGRARRVGTLVLISAATLVFCVQTVYFTIFKTFLTLYSVSGTGEAIGSFGGQTLAGIARSAWPLLLLMLPLAVLIASVRRLTAVKTAGFRTFFSLAAAAAALQLSAAVLIRTGDAGLLSDRYIYTESFSPSLSVPRFGVLTTLRLDIKNMLENRPGVLDAKYHDEAGNTASPRGSAPAAAGVEKIGGFNTLDIDFEGLIAGEKDAALLGMHRYFSAVAPTRKNAYTGLFKDYNLVWIVAEGFSTLALDKTHTPTLWKLANGGFQFSNFYNPVWSVSTSDGEYVASTGLLPKAGVWSYYKSASNHMPFGFGRLFSALDYEARAYHDGTYTYYKRDKSYPNMGYVYKGIGNGLCMKKQWPASDLEMMEVTIPEYAGDSRFHTYYMTVSGHLNYSFAGNAMAYKHKSAVADLPYSEPPGAYIACQMEFDQAVKLLIDRLGAAGALDRTVIAISGDHYPYGLTVPQMEEITGKPIEANFELYRSTFIVWNSAMKPVRTDKFCSSLDIMPTLANLFGLPYDSRLIMGTDILSDSPPLVIFNNRSFITDRGRYNALTDQFVPVSGAAAPKGYASETLAAVKNKFKYSSLILDKDYYGVLFGP
jgi:phosphoglycerol transferase MdoB-like AlkP superfamily enzyme